MVDTVKSLFNKFRYTLVGAIFALAVGTVGAAALVQPTASTDNATAAIAGQVGSAPRCTVKAVGERGSAFHNSNSGKSTTVKFKVTGDKDCKVQLSANSFYAPSMNGRPYDKQILFKRETKIFSQTGTYSMTVALPTQSTPAKGCYYQVDLTYGLKNHLPVLAYGHGKIPGCGEKPEPKLTCVDLSKNLLSADNRQYQFTAKAKAENTKITKYVFNFGDGKKLTKTSSKNLVTVKHSYAKAGTYTANVHVYSQDVKNVTSTKCKVTVKIKEQPKTPVLVCNELSYTAVDGKTDTYEFVAKATAENTTITNYVFSYDDGKSDTVTTAETTASATHTFPSDNKDHAATVTVNGTDVEDVTSESCAVSIPATPEPPVTPPETPKVLPDTGAGEVIGFFSATSLAGGLIHRFILRRRVA